MNSVGVLLCVGAFMLFSVIGISNSLECFTCNATLSKLNFDDPCNGTGHMQECQDPAVCLSATYSFKDQSSPPNKQFATFKTCYQVMNGEECKYFLKAIQNANPDKGNIEFADICYVCGENGCNKLSVSGKNEVKQPELVVLTL